MNRPAVPLEQLASWLPPEAVASAPDAVPVVSPADIGEASKVLQWAQARNLRVLPMGSGRHLQVQKVQTTDRPRVDLALSTRRMNRVLEYEPDDLTLVAEAGVTLRELQRTTSVHGQRLALDTAANEATLGGAVAMNRVALNRLRHGGWRDVLLGARTLGPSGTVTKTGGKVVKNVTGYDLGKLYVGSMGTLQWIAEVNLRLITMAKSSATLRYDLPASKLQDRLGTLREAEIMPSALLAIISDSNELLVRFDASPDSVTHQVEVVEAILGKSVPAGNRYEQRLEWLEGTDGRMLLRFGTLASEALELAQDLYSKLREEVCVLYGTGLSVLRLVPDEVAAHKDYWRTLRQRGVKVNLGGGSTALDGMDPGLAELQAQTKRVFDPDGIFPDMTY